MNSTDHRLISEVPPVDPLFPCENVPSLFSQYNTPSVVVVRDGKPIGLLSQRRIESLLSKRFGFALYEKRPVTELMFTEFLTVEIEGNFSNIVQQALSREEDAIYEDLVAVRNSEYVGLISIARVLIEQRARISQHVSELEQRGQQLQEVNNKLSDAIHELQVKEAQLIQSEKMAGIGTLASGIAHDFNNMLGAILGAAQLLKAKIPKEPSLVRYCDMIDNAVSRSAGLVRQLLQFSQKNIMSFRPVALNGLVEETVRLLERSIGKDIRIELALDHELDPINADDHQIQQVLMNLALNARDAMPNGGLLRISTESRLFDSEYCRLNKGLNPGLYVVLMVEDSGMGIAPENLRKIFDPFFSTKDVGKGTGLGLAVVYGIVQRHGGHIEVKSIVGRGSNFCVYLPASEVHYESQVADIIVSQTLESGEGNILLVDDESLVLRANAEFLESLGYCVFQASDGETALQIFREHREEIDLVVLDMAMPGMDGIDTLKNLQKINPEVSAFFVSGYSDENRYRGALSQGALGFVKKPFNHNDFSRQIKELIRDRIGRRPHLPN